LVAEKARGFIYLVSLTGVTGARTQLSDRLGEFVGRIRRITSTPIAIGFGVSTPEQAGEVSQIADGVIVGSALVQSVDRAEDKPQAAARTSIGRHALSRHPRACAATSPQGEEVGHDSQSIA
jgi:tryptophan synthase alpha chain